MAHLFIMRTKTQILFYVQMPENFFRQSNAGHRKISEMINAIFFAYHIIPSGNYKIVQLFAREPSAQVSLLGFVYQIWQNDFKSMPRRELVLFRGLRKF